MPILDRIFFRPFSRPDLKLRWASSIVIIGSLPRAIRFSVRLLVRHCRTAS